MSKRPLPRDLDPKKWHAHPAWARQAYGALVGFHDRYRRETSKLVAAAMDDAQSLDDIRQACEQLEGYLHNHEAVEEQGLYPWIEARYEVDLGSQREQHAALNAVLASVIALVREEGCERTALRARLVALDEGLRAHLAAEEAVCVPALLSASEAEFAELTGD